MRGQPRWESALYIVSKAETTHYTHGANHYENLALSNPAWAKGQTPTAVIGRHTFFKLAVKRDGK